MWQRRGVKRGTEEDVAPSPSGPPTTIPHRPALACHMWAGPEWRNCRDSAAWHRSSLQSVRGPRCHPSHATSRPFMGRNRGWVRTAGWDASSFSCFCSPVGERAQPQQPPLPSSSPHPSRGLLNHSCALWFAEASYRSCLTCRVLLPERDTRSSEPTPGPLASLELHRLNPVSF